MEISEIESRVTDVETIFHKPLNRGFVAIDDRRIYVVRERDEGFQFEEIQRRHVHTLNVREGEFESAERYEGAEDVEKTTAGRPCAELRIVLPGRTVTVIIEGEPEDVTRDLLAVDLPE